jgi:O-antigen biosynthesis protein
MSKSFSAADGAQSSNDQAFARWVIEAAQPRLLAYAVTPVDDRYLAWCKALSDIAPDAHAYALDIPGGSPGIDEWVQAENDVAFHSFSHVLKAPLDAALESLPDSGIDILVLSAPVASPTLALWLPKLTAQGVIVIERPERPADSYTAEESWASLRDSYPSAESGGGRYRMILVGRDAPPRLREAFGPQDRALAMADALPSEDAMGRADAVHVPIPSQQVKAISAIHATMSDHGRLDQIEVERAAYEKKLQALTRALEHAEQSARVAQQNFHAKQQEVHAIIHSRSWTVTKPLRAATTVLRFGRDLARGTIRQVASLPKRASAEGWRNVARTALTSTKHPLRTVRRLTGRAGIVPERVYKLPGALPAHERLVQRVLIIAEMSLAQCTKYRVLQKQQMIEDLGIDCTVVSWHDLDSARDFLQTHTAVIFYRVPGFEAQLETIRIAKELGVATFWEVDDLIFDAELYESNSNLNDLPKQVRQSILNGVPLYRKAMLACDACIASTDALAGVMRKVGVKDVFVVHNALDDETSRVAEEINATPRRSDGLIRIVYGSGSASHDSDFREAAPALKKVLESRYDVRLTIIGSLNLPEDFKDLEPQIERLPPSDYATYMRRLAKCHVNIAPLESSIFNDAKSNIKYLEAGILKLPSVVSRTAEFEATVQHGDTGFLASTPEEWEEVLMRLVEDEALRRDVGERAYRHVIEHYTPEVVAHESVRPVLARFDRFKPKRLRVLGVNIFFEPRSFGGATIVAEQVARRINRRDDVDYAMLTSLPTSDVAPYKLVRYQSSSAEVFAMGLPFEANPAFDFDNPYPLYGFREILRSWRPDVVHLHSIQGFGIQIAEACHAEGIPFAVTAHDAWWICARQFMITNEGRYCQQRKVDINVCAKCVVHPALNPYRQFRLHEVLATADRLLVPSAFFRELYAENGFDRERIVVNKNGVVPPARKPTRTPPSTRPLRFGFVGGEGPAKGSELIKQVLREMPEYTNYELQVVDGALNLGRRVIFEHTWEIPGTLRIVPAYTQQTIDDFYEGIDVLLFPTQCKESFGLSVREAMIRDVWVISTDAGGAVEDIVDGINGDIVPLEDDGAEFKKALKRLLDHPERLDGYVNSRVDMIRVFDEQAEELVSVLSGIATAKPIPATTTVG